MRKTPPSPSLPELNCPKCGRRCGPKNERIGWFAVYVGYHCEFCGYHTLFSNNPNVYDPSNSNAGVKEFEIRKNGVLWWPDEFVIDPLVSHSLVEPVVILDASTGKRALKWARSDFQHDESVIYETFSEATSATEMDHMDKYCKSQPPKDILPGILERMVEMAKRVYESRRTHIDDCDDDKQNAPRNEATSSKH